MYILYFKRDQTTTTCFDLYRQSSGYYKHKEFFCFAVLLLYFSFHYRSLMQFSIFLCCILGIHVPDYCYFEYFVGYLIQVFVRYW